MKETYGYQPLSYELTELFSSIPPDYAAAEELIRKGANINDYSSRLDENLLSDVLYDFCDKNRNLAEDEEIFSPPSARESEIGEALLQTIQFFLDHGFNLSRDNGRFGAMCLNALKFATSDRYLVKATKLLLDEGAQNVPPYADDNDRLLDIFDTEYSYQVCCENNRYTANIIEAIYMIYYALENGKPYTDIDCFEAAYGKEIKAVLAETTSDEPPFFECDFEHSHQANCYNCTLYFVYDDGCLIASEYSSFWVDRLPTDKPLIDVSERFQNIVGQKIKLLSFDPMEYIKCSPYDGSPDGALCFTNGIKLLFFFHHTGAENERCSYICFDGQLDSMKQQLIKTVHN